MNRYLIRACATVLAASYILVVASCRENNQEVASNPTASNVPAAAAPKGPPNYGGAVDNVTCDAISGWVWNSSNPADDIKVDIFADGTLLGTVPANIPRADVNKDLKTFGATGNYAFGFNVPAAMKDGKMHAVSVKVSGSSYDIKVWENIKPSFTCKQK